MRIATYQRGWFIVAHTGTRIYFDAPRCLRIETNGGHMPVNMVMNLPGSVKCSDILECRSEYWLLKKDSAPSN
jgi:hypothetical protein